MGWQIVPSAKYWWVFNVYLRARAVIKEGRADVA